MNKTFNDLTIEPVYSPEQIHTLASLAAEIWEEHYLPILGKDQVTYMLKHIQSEETITKDIESGKSSYFFLIAEGKKAGYLAIQLQPDALFISKLYLLKTTRGKGYASKVIQEMIVRAKKEKKEKITLTVNKYNKTAISFYEKAGFEKYDAMVSQIGGGFVMDDFAYVYTFSNK